MNATPLEVFRKQLYADYQRRFREWHRAFLADQRQRLYSLEKNRRS